MSDSLVKILRLWPALPLLAGIAFPAALWSQDIAETPENSEQQPVENASEQDAQEPKPPSDFKPSEEISEDFPVPLPSDI